MTTEHNFLTVISKDAALLYQTAANLLRCNSRFHSNAITNIFSDRVFKFSRRPAQATGYFEHLRRVLFRIPNFINRQFCFTNVIAIWSFLWNEWYENLPLEWNKSFLFHFFHKLIKLFHFSPAGKKRAYVCLCVCMHLYVFEKTRVSCYKLCEESKSIKLQMLALKK